MNLNQYIEGQAPYGWSLEKESGSGGTLSLRWRVLHGETDTHTAALNSTVAGEGFSYTLKEREKRQDAAGGVDVTYSYRDSLRELDDVPCFLRSNLPPRARAATLAAARWGLTAMVDANDVLAACATAAARAGITLDYSGLDAGLITVPLLDNGSSVAEVLDEVGRRVPNYTTRVSGNTVSVWGGQGELVSSATRATAVIQCSPDMKAGTLTVGTTDVDLAEVYRRNRASAQPLNWYSGHARLICDALADCAEADAMVQGRYIFLTAREAGAAGNNIALSYNGTPAGGTKSTARLRLPEDLAQAGTLTDGENTLELEVAEGTAAVGTLYYEFEGQGFEVGGSEHYFVPPPAILVADANAWTAAMTEAGCPARCTAVQRGPGDFAYAATIEALEGGTGGNSITLVPDAGNRVSGPTLEGGADGARDIDDLVDAINEPENPEVEFPFRAGTVGGVAASVTLAGEGWRVRQVTLYEVTGGGSTVPIAVLDAGHVVETVQEFLDLINGGQGYVGAWPDGDNVIIEATSDEYAGTAGNALILDLDGDELAFSGGRDDIMLTAKVAGSAGNGIGVQTDGCFGTAGQFSGGTDPSGLPCVLTPFSGGSGTEVRAPYDGLLGMRARQTLPDNLRVTRRSVTYDAADLAPTCVVGVYAVGGQQVVAFVVPNGASPYQKGALVVEVDIARTQQAQIERKSWEYDPEKARELAKQEVRVQARQMGRLQAQTQPWMCVKGTPIPSGGSPAKLCEFWGQFGAFATLKKCNGTGLSFEKMTFKAKAATDAYPPEAAPDFEEAKKRLPGGMLGPSILEHSNVPANYKALTFADNLHLLVEGSFPASSKTGANVGGLKFCFGTLTQRVRIVDTVTGITKEEGCEFFTGGDKNGRYTILEVEGVFINRGWKRYQTGTNKQDTSDPDYDEDKDAGENAGWYIIGDREEQDPEPEQGLSKTDYIEASKAFLAACGERGDEGRTEEITAHVMDGDFDTSLTVDDVFAALDMEPAASGGFSYDAETRTLTARGCAGQRAHFELDDFLTRRRAEKDKAWLDWKERHRDAAEQEPREGDSARDIDVSYPLTPQEVQDEKEKESPPMVSPSISASVSTKKYAKPLQPFEIYADGQNWYMNEGKIVVAGGEATFPTTLLQGNPRNYHYFVRAVYNQQRRSWEVKLLRKSR
ncbi:MAG: hypothetical protein MJ074_06400 [Oscillospiraceae bacterium]|nr:hypothetical protein [Oscillospiraceae bacterium]